MGVLLMDLGAPTDLDDVEGYIARLLSREGLLPLPGLVRAVAARAIARRRAPIIRRRYEAIGGVSPLSSELAALAVSLERRLGGRLPVAVGTLCSSPTTEEGLMELVRRGCRRVVGVPLFAHEARVTWRACAEELAAVAGDRGVPAAITPSFPEGDRFLACLEELTRPVVGGVDRLLMVAHGLPRSHIRRGDPYLGQVRRTAAALSARLELPRHRWALAFQSRFGPGRWTEPSVQDALFSASIAGARSVAVLPLSFACENLETRWDLDHELTRLAHRLGVERLSRLPAPGSHPLYLEQLATLVTATALGQGWLEREGLNGYIEP